MTLGTKKTEAWLLQRAALGLDVDVMALSAAVRQKEQYAHLLAWFVGSQFADSSQKGLLPNEATGTLPNIRNTLNKKSTSHSGPRIAANSVE